MCCKVSLNKWIGRVALDCATSLVCWWMQRRNSTACTLSGRCASFCRHGCLANFTTCYWRAGALLSGLNGTCPSSRPVSLPASACQYDLPSAASPRRLARQDWQPRNHRMESKRLAHALINFVRRNHDEHDVLFDLAGVFSIHAGASRSYMSRKGVGSLILTPWYVPFNLCAAAEFSFVKAFLSAEVPREFSVARKREVGLAVLRNNCMLPCARGIIKQHSDLCIRSP